MYAPIAYIHEVKNDVHVLCLVSTQSLFCLTGAEGCFVSPDAQFNMDYRGTLNVTIGGVVCQKWTINTPHQVESVYDLSADGLGDHNYCRNPREYVRNKVFVQYDVWCYTTNPSLVWDYCCL